MAGLSGKKVIVTRGAPQNESLCSALKALGADVIPVPTVRFAPAKDPRPWRQALDRRTGFTHVAFTSQVAVRYFLVLSSDSGFELSDWRHCRLSAIGAATARTLREAGWPPDLVARGTGGIEFATELIEKERLGPGMRMLLPQSELARYELEDLLRAAGVAVDAVSVYQTLAETPEKAEPFRRSIAAGEKIDAITFASPSAVRFFLEMTGDEGRREIAVMRIVSIGSTTSKAVEEAGFAVAAEARAPGTPGLVEAVLVALG